MRLSELAAAGLVDRMRATFETYWASDAFEPFDPENDGERLREALDSATGQATESRRWSTSPLTLFRAPPGLACWSNCRRSATATTVTVTFCCCDGHGQTRDGSAGLIAVSATLAKPSPAFRRSSQAHLGPEPSHIRDGPQGPGLWRDPGRRRRTSDSGRHVFAMVQSLHNEASPRLLGPNDFEVVVIDEVRFHAAAPSYRVLLEHLLQPIELRRFGRRYPRTHGRRGHHPLVRSQNGGRTPTVGGHRRGTSRRSSTSASTTMSTSQRSSRRRGGYRTKDPRARLHHWR